MFNKLIQATKLKVLTPKTFANLRHSCHRKKLRITFRSAVLSKESKQAGVVGDVLLLIFLDTDTSPRANSATSFLQINRFEHATLVSVDTH